MHLADLEAAGFSDLAAALRADFYISPEILAAAAAEDWPKLRALQAEELHADMIDYVIASAEENNELNDAPWHDWESGMHLAEVYLREGRPTAEEAARSTRPDIRYPWIWDQLSAAAQAAIIRRLDTVLRDQQAAETGQSAEHF